MVKSAGTALFSRLVDQGDKMFRSDSWVNMALGFGTSRDKTQGSSFLPSSKLTDIELAALYRHCDYAAKIVNVYPREAMREGYCLSGLDGEKIKKAEKFLAPWDLKRQNTNAAIWGRLFGGGALWFGTEDGAMPNQPMGDTPKITFMRFYDRRFLQPYRFYETGPKVGLPETYMLFSAERHAKVAEIHESRLIIFPGARTEALAKRENNGWDDSVLQVAYEAIRSEGGVWKSIETLVSDANQAVFKISKLWSMMSTQKGEELRTRVQLMDLMRSVSRAILLDKDTEDFERKMTTFTGLDNLSDKAKQRVASAAEIPVTVLTGESPAGLNATGDSDLRWFFARVHAYQETELEPIILPQIRLILKQEGSPLRPEEVEELTLKWKPLWSATDKERAEIFKLRADANVAQVGAEIVLPEEVALSEYGGEDGGELRINTKARERILKSEEQKLLEQGKLDTPQDSNADPSVTEDPNAAPVVADPNAEAKDPTTALNGAQVTALKDIVIAVAEGQLPRQTGVEMIVASFPIAPDTAEKIMGEVGKTFEPKKPDPPPVVPGAAPPVENKKPDPTDDGSPRGSDFIG